MTSSVSAPSPLALYLSWVGTLSGTLLLLLGDVLPVRLPFVRPDTVFVCLLEVEVAFLLFIWPLFVLRRAERPPGSEGRGLVGLLGDAGLLLVASLPLTMIAANISNVGGADVGKAVAFLAAMAAFPACLLSFAAGRRWPAAPGYFLAAFLVSALLPFLRFLEGPTWDWASGLSPFWAAGAGDFLWPAAVYGGLAAAVVGASRLSRTGVDAPSAAR
jgi:hypothetical protein